MIQNNNTQALDVVSNLEVQICGDSALRFGQLVNEGIEAWSKAGKLLVQMLEAFPEARSTIMQKCPSISLSTLMTFEKIGRRQVSPHLLLESCYAAKKLLSFPVELQERLLQEPIQVVTDVRQGKPVVRKINLRSLTKSEADRAFSDVGLRPESEQAEMIRKEPDIELSREQLRKIRYGPTKVERVAPVAAAELHGIPIGRYSVRLGVGGVVVFEKTKAPASPDKVIKIGTVIEIVKPHTEDT